MEDKSKGSTIGDIFDGLNVTPEGVIVPTVEGELALVVNSATTDVSHLLPIADLQLTQDEALKIAVFQQARLILGPAGGSVLICAGEKCPFSHSCPLIKMKKAPIGELCPFEANYIARRFADWLLDFEKTRDNLSEAERATISNLVYLDAQEQRCLSILAKAQNATLTSKSVKEVDVQSGQAISWEEIIHANQQTLNQLQITRRMIFKEWELTPEAKTKRAKILGKPLGQDVASKQSAAADKLREALSTAPTTINIQVNAGDKKE